MNVFDPILVVLLLAGAYGGHRLGFVTRAFSWALLATGFVVGIWAVPKVLRAMRAGSSSGQLLVAAVVLLIAFAVVGQAIGLLIGSRVAHRVASREARRLDQRGGAVAGAVGIVGLIWIVAPVMATVPGTPAELARGSAVVQVVTRVLPSAPDLTHGLRALVGPVAPPVFTDGRRTASAGPVPAGHGIPPEIVDRVIASTVRIEGRACAVTQEGSGFVVAPDRVVTNAHVIAGEESTQVITADGRRLTGVVETFDTRRDVAVLRVSGLDLEPLELSVGRIGTTGAVFGFPSGGDLELSPFRIADSVDAVGRDIYDRYPVRRSVLILATELAPGDSGAPLVDGDGNVVGMAFAIAPDRGDVGYALQAADLYDTNTSGAITNAGRCLG